MVGTIDITGYNATATEETGLTKFFLATGISGYAKGILSCICGMSDNGYWFNYEPNTGMFKAWKSAGTEADTDTDCGSAQFIAVGLNR